MFLCVCVCVYVSLFVASNSRLQSVRVVHDKVLQSSPAVPALPQDAGQTTLLGASVVRLASSEPDEWALVLVSVGDVKCFVLGTDAKMREVTIGNRGNAHDASDCGGRLGPLSPSNLNPDLRNLRCYYEPVRAGEMVILMSDGVA